MCDLSPFTFHLYVYVARLCKWRMDRSCSILAPAAVFVLGDQRRLRKGDHQKNTQSLKYIHILRCHAYNYNSCCFHCLVGKGCTGRDACIGSRPSTNSQTTTRRWVSILDVRCPPVSPSLPCWGTDCRDDSGELCRLAVFTRCVKLLNSEQLQSQTAQELVGKLLVEVYTCRV